MPCSLLILDCLQAPYALNQRGDGGVSGLLPPGEEVPELVIPEFQQPVQCSDLPVGERVPAAVEKAGQDQVVLQQAPAAPPAQTRQLSLINHSDFGLEAKPRASP